MQVVLVPWLELCEPFDEVNDLWLVVANDSLLVSLFLCSSRAAIDLGILDVNGRMNEDSS